MVPGVDLMIRKAAEKVAEIVGYNGEVVWDSDKPDGTLKKLLNVERLFRLGWSPKVAFEEGLKNSYEWFLEQ